MRRRRRVSRGVEVVSTAASLLAVAVLLIVVGSVLVRGIGAISLDFFIKETPLFGESGGGISNAIVGTGLLIGMAAVVAVPMGLLVAIYTSEFASPQVRSFVRFSLDVLNGIPSIVIGIFVFGLLVDGSQQSAIAGAFALGVIMLPIVARTAMEALDLVPNTLEEAAHALGVTRWRTVLRITLPTAAGGLLTGVLLAVARIAGETAPLILVCSIFTNTVSTNVSEAVASIPVTIFNLSESPNPDDHATAWAAALLLIAFVLVLNVIARAIFARSQRRMQG